MFAKFGGLLLAVVGGIAIGGIALQRDEPINSLWLVTAAICVYVLGYRFYAKWIETRAYVIDRTRATPAERLNNGRDFVPTHRWVLFGHHFAAIAGAGPLVGPTLAMQFGYLPGTLWLLVGAVLGGCVQDMIILFMSTRRNGKSLGQMARDELGPVGGTAAVLGTLMIVVIIIAVLGLVIVKAMQHSPWATFTVFATIRLPSWSGISCATGVPVACWKVRCWAWHCSSLQSSSAAG
jgi:carbon starvation protein